MLKVNIQTIKEGLVEKKNTLQRNLQPGENQGRWRDPAMMYCGVGAYLFGYYCIGPVLKSLVEDLTEELEEESE